MGPGRQSPAPQSPARHPLARLGRGLASTAIDVEPLRHPDFRRLFLGQGVAFIGYQLTAVAVSVQVYALTGSSLWVGLLGVAALVPLIVFGLYGGAIADAVDRRLLYISSSTLVWAATGGLLVQALLQVRSPVLVLGLVAVQSVGFAVSSPVRQAIVPRLLAVRLVPAGNTLSFTMSNVGLVSGPLIAGVVISRYGYAAPTASMPRCSPSASTQRCAFRACRRAGRRSGSPACARSSRGCSSSPRARCC